MGKMTSKFCRLKSLLPRAERNKRNNAAILDAVLGMARGEWFVLEPRPIQFYELRGPFKKRRGRKWAR